MKFGVRLFIPKRVLEEKVLFVCVYAVLLHQWAEAKEVCSDSVFSLAISVVMFCFWLLIAQDLSKAER